MTDPQKRDLLNDFFQWSGGELPTSPAQIQCYMDCACGISQLSEQQEREAIDYLTSEIIDDSLFGQN